MNRTTWYLISLIVLELLIGGAALVVRARMSIPPWPVEDGLAELDRAELRALYRRACRGGRAAWLELARTYAAYGYLPEAVVCYRHLARSWSGSDSQVLFELGFYSGQLGMAEEAVEHLSHAIDRGLNAPERAWYFIAQNQMRREQLEEAKAALRRAEPLPAASYELARIYNKTNQPERALQIAKPMIRSFRFHYPFYFIEARAYQLQQQNQKELEAALNWFRFASPLRGPFDDLHDEVSQRRSATAFERARKKCYTLLQQGLLDELRVTVDQLTAMKWSSDLADLRAELATRQGQASVAEKELRDAIHRDGASLHLLWRLGDVLFDSGRWEEAWIVWDEAVEIGRGQRELGEFLTYVMLKAEGRGELARGKKYDGARWLAEGKSHLARGEFLDATEKLKKATEFLPDDAHVWYLYGEACWRNGQPVLARQAYQRCLQLNPHHGRAKWSLSVLP
jgi:tetratricopeptide (TPR) repeat protein